MSVPQPQYSLYHDRTNGHCLPVVSGPTQNRTRPADPTSTGQGISYPQHGAIPSQDPFTYYKAYLDTESAPKVHSNHLGQKDDGATQSRSQPEALSMQGSGGSHQDKPRPVPYNLAVRFANRLNKAPLATIIEQGSVSTLNSHGSLLSVGRFPSIRNPENVLPDRALRVPSQNLDENTLRAIQEENIELGYAGHYQTPVACSTEHMRNGQPGYEHDHTTITTSINSEASKTTRLPEISLACESRRLTVFLRGVITTVRGTRERSCSSPSMDSSVLATSNQLQNASPKADISEMSSGSTESRERSGHLQASGLTLQETPISPCQLTRAGAAKQPSPQKTSSVPTFMDVPVLHLSHLVYEPTAPLSSAPQLSQHPDLPIPSRDNEASLKVCHARPIPRDAAIDHVFTAATAFLSRSRDELAARYTPDGAGVYQHDEGSIRDGARGSSRNASFCSSMSTSYSGTVLGIDLDLQHEFPHSFRRPVTPVWFNPTETVRKDEKQSPPKRQFQLESAKPLRPRSITSSALTSLLPIAAAEGIVQQNLTTPQISFYSPSGNLIQAQDNALTPTPASSSRSRSDTYFSGSPVAEQSGYNKANFQSAHSILSAAVSLPPARPAPVPRITPVQSTAPLPECLRYHHNSQHAERTRIRSTLDSEPTLLVPSGSNSRGCGEMVRPTSLEPHSDVSQSPQKHSRFKHSISSRCVSRENGSRFQSLLSSWSASTSACHLKSRHEVTQSLRTKGRTLQKRCLPRTSTAHENESVGSVTGHVIQTCFCQPYDGVVNSTSESNRGGATTHPRDLQSKACPPELSTGTPNARVVAREGNAGGKGRSKVRVRSDSVVSVGIRAELTRA